MWHFAIWLHRFESISQFPLTRQSADVEVCMQYISIVPIIGHIRDHCIAMNLLASAGRFLVAASEQNSDKAQSECQPSFFIEEAPLDVEFLNSVWLPLCEIQRERTLSTNTISIISKYYVAAIASLQRPSCWRTNEQLL